MKILYSEGNKALRNLLAVSIESSALDIEVIDTPTDKDAREYLEKNRGIGVVISDFGLSRKEGVDLYHYVKDKMPQGPFVLLSAYKLEDLKELTNFSSDPNNYYIPKTDQYQSIVDNLMDIIKTKSELNLADSQYCKINTNRLLNFEKIPCDCFIKLSDDKYIRVLKENELDFQTIILKYQEKKIRYFYIRHQDYPSLTKYIATSISSKLTDKQINSKDRIDIEFASIDFVFEEIENLGISKDVIETIDNVVESNILIIKKQPKLFSLIKNIMKDRDYRYEHGLLASYLSGAIATQMEWNTESTLQKLSFAGILHDLSIEDSTLCCLHDLRPDHSKITAEQKKFLNLHTIKVSQMIKDSKSSFPADIDTIIMSHHENEDGTGYPRKLNSSNLSPMACIFIIAKDFAKKIYEKKTSHLDILDIIDEFQIKYENGNFKKPVESLISLLRKGQY